ncbi:MAG: radical SAM protein [Polyangia bacterium]|jgi:radical SAM superfamily enzyme YgiQ (UPF0313 family)|nr:radical SAM protein [Polyangia bacterium]
MISIPVDDQGNPQRHLAGDGAEPLLLYGRGLLAYPKLLELIRRMSGGGRPICLSTDRLHPTVDPPEALASAGLRAIEVPIPTADARLLDSMAKADGELARSIGQARAWWRASVDLLARVPVGSHNRDGLEELTRALTSDFPGLRRVLFHCSPSLGASHRGQGERGPQGDLQSRLYAQAVELEDARIRVVFEHRDGFGLCLFASQPEPLRYFRLEDVAPCSRRADPNWIYPLSTQEARLSKVAPCAGCALAGSCHGLHRALITQPFAVQVVPFERDPREHPIEAPRGTVFLGSAHRLRGTIGLAEARREASEGRGLPYAEQVEVSPEDSRELGLHRIRLDGFHLALVRVPWLGPQVEPIVPSLALTALVPFVRAAGARVDPFDAKLALGRPGDSSILVPRSGICPSDVPRQSDDIGTTERQQLDLLASQLSGPWPLSADLLGLSVEVPECLPLALALTRDWKRRGGRSLVLGGLGIGDPGRLMAAAPELDFCVHGEGEVPLLLLADALMGHRDLAEVPGLWRRLEDGQLEETHSVVHSLDLHVPPDVSGLPLDSYDPIQSLGGTEPAFLYQFILGCPHACAFCGEHNRYRYRVRTPELVVRDLRFAARELGRRQFFFVNTLINVTSALLDGWLDAMERASLPIEWSDCCRPSGLRPDQLRRMHGVGCRALTWGPDILSQALNRRLWKNLNLERSAALLREAKRLGIRNTVNVIMGMPTERDDDVEETIQYLQRHSDCFDEVFVGVYGFRRRSPIGRWPARFGLSLAQDGVEEIGGRTWSALLEHGIEAQRRVIEAVRDHVPVAEPAKA